MSTPENARMKRSADGTKLVPEDDPEIHVSEDDDATAREAVPIKKARKKKKVARK